MHVPSMLLTLAPTIELSGHPSTIQLVTDPSDIVVIRGGASIGSSMQLLFNNVRVEVALRRWALTKSRSFFIGLLTLSRTYIAARKAPSRGNLDIFRTFAERERAMH
jgi:hypothetical protein